MNRADADQKIISPPGIRFRNAYAAVCEEEETGFTYSTFSNLESLESYLESNEVEAVRLNELEEEPDILSSFEPERVVNRNGKLHAASYGKSDLVTFEGEFLDEGTLFENQGEILE